MTLHEGLTKIEDGAFHDCLKLKKIRIPKSVTDIGEMALGIRYNRRNGAEEVIPGGFTVEGYTGSAAERYVKSMHQSENITVLLQKNSGSRFRKTRSIQSAG